ncbi:hypothetical protein M8C21_024818 [Ambrosia artemisiifolia]|uniref:Uncharacterized protein n=1 Tax=Ambrosia artemisiifolia TaxID=4212 RepID=A0AAD5GT10_AMBAR|nr:hypothetical protein M8C21_024818 [Ambrosia artemisiifolia]
METSLKGLASVITVVTVGVLKEDDLGFHHEPLAATMVFQGSRKVPSLQIMARYRLYREWKRDDECNPMVLSSKKTTKLDTGRILRSYTDDTIVPLADAYGLLMHRNGQWEWTLAPEVVPSSSEQDQNGHLSSSTFSKLLDPEAYRIVSNDEREQTLNQLLTII